MSNQFELAKKDTEQLKIFKGVVNEQTSRKTDMLKSFGLSSRMQAIQQQEPTPRPMENSSSPTPLAMSKTQSEFNNRIDLNGSFLLPESIAFLIANAVQ